MSITSTVLFDRPHEAIASLIGNRIAASDYTSIVVGFATPGGLAAIDGFLRAAPQRLKKLVIGAATYPAFQALDELSAAGVPQSHLRIHLGHTMHTGGRKNPFARYHPMLHSKIYYMELPNNRACAFIGSNNLTSFALGGLNGEAAVMLEGPTTATEFDKVRRHIDAVADESMIYSPTLKEAFAWWSKQYFEGLDAEVNLPRDWSIVRTILIFAKLEEGELPKVGDKIYFEIPLGIQIESFKTEVHLYLLNVLPPDPADAISCIPSSYAKFTCGTIGADNEQGNDVVRADWRIEQFSQPILRTVPGGRHRTSTPADMQQVRANVALLSVRPYEYAFEREGLGWEPVLSPDNRMPPPKELENKIALSEAQGGRSGEDWRLVTNLIRRAGSPVEKDQAALARARPDSGSFVLVALRRRMINGLTAE
ncbi:phospholipase D family protein [Azospirillum doebereinerae]|uniref:NgoFVII family restriction endonuclease n=1 Tax=Azospirillum doebereinerae TaxID=92933 RepID=A0A433J5U0_9PROT|nr:phospholipase D family protein [Azospirillum doebereinerae]RUQ68101.1 NgoFVII family restriction endonuclease [Azospirillum doebereinerae]